MRKLLLATAAVFALASPALAEDYIDSPAMATTMFSQNDPKEAAKLSMDGCKNYAINVFNKTGAHDLDTNFDGHSVFAAMDFDSHAYLASIRCEVNKQYAVVFIAVTGADQKYASEALHRLASTWNGQNNKPTKPDLTATAKKKGHNI